MICEDDRRSGATFSRRGLRDAVIYGRDERRADDGREGGGTGAAKRLKAEGREREESHLKI